MNHLWERLTAFEKKLVLETPVYRRYRYDRETLDELAAVLASYLGHFKLANHFNLWQQMWRKFPFLSRYFDWNAQRSCLARKDVVPSGFQRVAQQYRHFRRRFPGHAVFMQVGRFVEFYQPGDVEWANRLGLKPVAPNRRGVRWGFPAEQMGMQLTELLRNRQPVLLVRESGWRLRNLEERLPLLGFEPVWDASESSGG